MKSLFCLLHLLPFILTFLTPASGKDYTLGLLIPFESCLSSTSTQGKYYAPAIVKALDDINNSSNLLPGHHLSFIWNDTECNEDQSLRALSYQIHERKVDAIIGPGSSCELEARLASALDIPMVSYVSFFLRYTYINPHSGEM